MHRGPRMARSAGAAAGGRRNALPLDRLPESRYLQALTTTTFCVTRHHGCGRHGIVKIVGDQWAVVRRDTCLAVTDLMANPFRESPIIANEHRHAHDSTSQEPIGSEYPSRRSATCRAPSNLMNDADTLMTNPKAWTPGCTTVELSRNAQV